MFVYVRVCEGELNIQILTSNLSHCDLEFHWGDYEDKTVEIHAFLL